MNQALAFIVECELLYVIRKQNADSNLGISRHPVDLPRLHPAAPGSGGKVAPSASFGEERVGPLAFECEIY